MRRQAGWPVASSRRMRRWRIGAESFKLATSGTPPMIPWWRTSSSALASAAAPTSRRRSRRTWGAGVHAADERGKNAGDESDAYFLGTTGKAIDVGAWVAYRFTKLIGARVGVELRQYGVRANRDGGAGDWRTTIRYIFFGGGIELVLDGVSGAVAEGREGGSPPRRRPAEATAPAEGEGGDKDN